MLKNLWVMRHGLAVSEFESDFSRALSEIGKRQVSDVIQQLMDKEKSTPQKMLVSPFVRTQETAGIAHKQLGLVEPFENEDLLVHHGDHKVLGDFLLSQDIEELMIVSHMPIVASLCQYLSPSCQVYGFQTAQIVKLVFDEKSNGTVTNIYTSK